MRNRVAKRGVQMAVDLAEKTKMRRREGTGELMEGEIPNKSWLEKHSGAILLPRKRRGIDPGLEEGVVEAVKAQERQQWHREAEEVVELPKDNLDLPILRGAEEVYQPRRVHEDSDRWLQSLNLEEEAAGMEKIFDLAGDSSRG